MKRKLFLVGVVSFALIIGFTVLGCGGGGSPTSVFKKYHAASLKGDMKAVTELMEPSAAALVSSMATGEDLKKAAEESGAIDKIEETIDGDTATLKVTFKNGKTDTVNMVKLDGKWKVSMGK